MKTRTIWTAMAAITLMSASVLAAAPASAASSTCQASPPVSSNSTTVFIKNPCGNLSGRYFVWRSNSTGVIWSSYVVVPPLGTGSFASGTGGWGVEVR